MTYEAWLQTKLREHGYYHGPIDGDWGRMSIAALEQFQRARSLPVTSVSDTATVNALKATVGGETVAPVQPEEKMPPWMAEMHRRMGLHEKSDNKELADWLKEGKYLGDPSKLPWCGDAIETCIAKTLPSESVPSNPFWAQGWNTFGIDVEQPIVGSIGVIRWSSSSGHVGIVVGVSGSTVNMLGGNQSNMVKVSGFNRKDFMGFRWPKTFPVKTYPALKGSAVSAGSLSSTR